LANIGEDSDTIIYTKDILHPIKKSHVDEEKGANLYKSSTKASKKVPIKKNRMDELNQNIQSNEIRYIKNESEIKINNIEETVDSLKKTLHKNQVELQKKLDKIMEQFEKISKTEGSSNNTGEEYLGDIKNLQL
jgi:hypothetical protein